MRLEQINAARMPGPGDFGPPEYSDDLEPTWGEMVQMEADAILAECETAAGAQQFADAWVDLDGHAPDSLVAMIKLIAMAPRNVAPCPGMLVVLDALRTEAERQAAERHPKPREERPC